MISSKAAGGITFLLPCCSNRYYTVKPLVTPLPLPLPHCYGPLPDRYHSLRENHSQ